MQNHLETVRNNLHENGSVCQIECLIKYGITPWTLQSKIKNLRALGYRISSDNLFIDTEYYWIDY